MWDSSQGQNVRDKAIFVTDAVNPQADIPSTWKCEIWVRDVDLQEPGSNKDSEGKPKIPEHITCQAACAYDIYGKYTGMLSLERLNILLHAYNQTKKDWPTQYYTTTCARRGNWSCRSATKV